MKIIKPKESKFACVEGCLPPADDLFIKETNAPAGSFAVCDHGTVWKAFDPSSLNMMCLYRVWGRAGWWDSRKARKA